MWTVVIVLLGVFVAYDGAMPSAPRRPGPSRPATTRSTPGWSHLAVWTSAVVATVLLCAATRIGPVLVILTPTHGIHIGDVTFALLAAVAATWYTASNHRLHRS
jgi:hypothetical protein